MLINVDELSKLRHSRYNYNPGSVRKLNLTTLTGFKLGSDLRDEKDEREEVDKSPEPSKSETQDFLSILVDGLFALSTLNEGNSPIEEKVDSKPISPDLKPKPKPKMKLQEKLNKILGSRDEIENESENDGDIEENGEQYSEDDASIENLNRLGNRNENENSILTMNHILVEPFGLTDDAQLIDVMFWCFQELIAIAFWCGGLIFWDISKGL